MKKNILTLALLSSLSVPAIAQTYQAGDILVRGGATLVAPDDNKSGVYVEALGGDTPLSLSVENNTQLGLNVVYFFDNNWAVELLAATPFSHDVKIHDPQGISSNVFGTNVDGITLAEVTHLPPTLSAIYYFDTGSKFKPYIGLGLNYTIFFDEEFKSAPQSLGFKDLDLDASFGISPQIGVDYQLDDHWHINASVRYIDISTDVSFNIGDSISGSASVDVDPFVYSLMLGYRF